MHHLFKIISPFVLALSLMTALTMANAADAPQQPAKPTILALGDSLVAGYGLPPGQSVPDQLKKALAKDGTEVEMINAGVSGDTTAGGLARLSWVLTDEIDLLIITLGGNDMLRSLPPAQSKKNLAAIIEQARAANPDIKILLTGMQAMPNLGEDYAARFNPIYEQLAAQYDLPLYPFYLDGVAANPDLNLADGIHPNEQGIAVIVERLLPHVQAALAE